MQSGLQPTNSQIVTGNKKIENLIYLPYREISTSLGSFEMFKLKMRRHLRQLRTKDVEPFQ